MIIQLHLKLQRNCNNKTIKKIINFKIERIRHMIQLNAIKYILLQGLESWKYKYYENIKTEIRSNNQGSRSQIVATSIKVTSYIFIPTRV